MIIMIYKCRSCNVVNIVPARTKVFEIQDHDEADWYGRADYMLCKCTNNVEEHRRRYVAAGCLAVVEDE